MKEPKVLFVCSANINRSKGFEKRFKEKYLDPENVRSSGIYSYNGYGYKLDEEIIQWADYVFVMTQAHKMFINKKYPEYLDKVHVIGISDEYNSDDKALEEVIDYWYETEFVKFI